MRPRRGLLVKISASPLEPCGCPCSASHACLLERIPGCPAAPCHPASESGDLRTSARQSCGGQSAVGDTLLREGMAGGRFQGERGLLGTREAIPAQVCAGPVGIISQHCREMAPDTPLLDFSDFELGRWSRWKQELCWASGQIS